MSLSSYNGQSNFTIKGKKFIKRGANNIYDIASVAGTGGGNYSSGWVNIDASGTPVDNNAVLTFKHNLGTTDLTAQMYLSSTDSSSGAFSIITHFTTGSHYTSLEGADIVPIDNNTVRVSCGGNGFSGKYIKVVLSAGGSGGGNGFIFSARGEGSAPLLIDDRVIYAIQVHDNENHYAVRVADKATGEILQCPMNDRKWPQWAGVTPNKSGWRANGIVDWKNATGSSVDIYYFHSISWVAKATFNRTTQTLGNIEPFGVDATGTGTNFFNHNWQPVAVMDNGSNKEFLSAYALAHASWNEKRNYNLAKMQYRMISPSYNIPDYTGVYQKLPDLMDIAKSTNGDFMVGTAEAASYHLLAGVNPINGKFYTYGMGTGVLNIFKMTGSYPDWGTRLYELTDSPQPTSTAGIEHLKAVQLGSHGTYSRYNFVSVQFDEYGNETGISFGALVDDTYRRNELTYIIPWNSNW